jgi:hypothetical protein
LHDRATILVPLHLDQAIIEDLPEMRPN